MISIVSMCSLNRDAETYHHMRKSQERASVDLVVVASNNLGKIGSCESGLTVTTDEEDYDD